MGKQLKAIIFDVDGTLADTEQYGHLPACNDAMKELGFDMKWSWPEFIKMIHEIPGNANRFAYELRKQGYRQNKIDHFAKEFANIKQDIYIKKYLPKLELRPGVEGILKDAVKRKIPLGIVSTSHESQINALLANQLDRFCGHFKVVMGKESGRKTENGGYLYTECLKKLKLQPENVLVIEDSEPGLCAAVCANIPTAVFYNDYTFGSAFKGARLVAPNLSTFSLESLEKICLN